MVRGLNVKNVLSGCTHGNYIVMVLHGIHDCQSALCLNTVLMFCCRAAAAGNVEALIKLGIAYLYNEGCKYGTQCETAMIVEYSLCWMP